MSDTLGAPSAAAAGAGPSAPSPRGQVSAGVISGLALLPGASPPVVDALSRATTAVTDFRHTVAAAADTAPSYALSGHANAPGRGSGRSSA
jgi:hypothetical protein